MGGLVGGAGVQSRSSVEISVRGDVERQPTKRHPRQNPAPQGHAGLPQGGKKVVVWQAIYAVKKETNCRRFQKRRGGGTKMFGVILIGGGGGVAGGGLVGCCGVFGGLEGG